jgi:hypothetical protein
MQTRILLPRSRYEEGLDLVVAGMSGVPYGDPMDPNNIMGPVVGRLSSPGRPTIDGNLTSWCQPSRPATLRPWGRR